MKKVSETHTFTIEITKEEAYILADCLAPVVRELNAQINKIHNDGGDADSLIERRKTLREMRDTFGHMNNITYCNE